MSMFEIFLEHVGFKGQLFASLLTIAGAIIGTFAIVALV